MRQLIVKQLDYDLTPVAGLALVGHYLRALQPVLGRLDTALPVKAGVANSDIAAARPRWSCGSPMAAPTWRAMARRVARVRVKRRSPPCA